MTGRTEIRDATTLRALQRWPVGADEAALSPDDHTLLLGGSDGSVRFLDLGTGDVRTASGRHAGPVMRATFGPDGRTAVTAGEDNRVIVWDVAARRHHRDARGPRRTDDEPRDQPRRPDAVHRRARRQGLDLGPHRRAPRSTVRFRIGPLRPSSFSESSLRRPRRPCSAGVHEHRAEPRRTHPRRRSRRRDREPDRRQHAAPDLHVPGRAAGSGAWHGLHPAHAGCSWSAATAGSSESSTRTPAASCSGCPAIDRAAPGCRSSPGSAANPAQLQRRRAADGDRGRRQRRAAVEAAGGPSRSGPRAATAPRSAPSTCRSARTAGRWWWSRNWASRSSTSPTLRRRADLPGASSVRSAQFTPDGRYVVGASCQRLGAYVVDEDVAAGRPGARRPHGRGAVGVGEPGRPHRRHGERRRHDPAVRRGHAEARRRAPARGAQPARRAAVHARRRLPTRDHERRRRPTAGTRGRRHGRSAPARWPDARSRGPSGTMRCRGARTRPRAPPDFRVSVVSPEMTTAPTNDRAARRPTADGWRRSSRVLSRGAAPFVRRSCSSSDPAIACRAWSATFGNCVAGRARRARALPATGAAQLVHAGRRRPS